MSHAAKTKKLRRAFTGAFRLEAQEAKTPCASCAFSDPEAWIADPGMGHAILICLSKPTSHKFYCHDGYPPTIRPDGSKGSYQVPLLPDGTADVSQLQHCGGFLRWAVKYRTAKFVDQFKAVMALQLQMCRRFLCSDYAHVAEFREMCDGRAEVLQEALNMQSIIAASGEDEED